MITDYSLPPKGRRTTGEDGAFTAVSAIRPKPILQRKDYGWYHPAECDCQRAAREKQQAAESRQKHRRKVEDLKRRGFTDPAMQTGHLSMTTAKPQTRNRPLFYVEAGKPCRLKISATCFGAAWGREKTTLPPVSPTPLWKGVAATILGDLAASFEGGTNIFPPLQLPSAVPVISVWAGTEYGLEQVYGVIDSRY